MVTRRFNENNHSSQGGVTTVPTKVREVGSGGGEEGASRRDVIGVGGQVLVTAGR